VNLKIPQRELETICRELLIRTPEMSGRALRAALQQRFGTRGKSERVYAIWRAVRSEQLVPRSTFDTVDLAVELEAARLQIATLETALFDAKKRAAQSEERERIHQDRWANEIYLLRQQLHGFEVKRDSGERQNRVVGIGSHAVPVTRDNNSK
jgi:hypothetical protein